MHRVAGATPAERQRHHRAQHRDGAEQIDRPETAAIAMAVVDCPSIETAVSRGQRLDERQQSPRRLRWWRCGRRPELHTDEQQALDELMQSHGRLTPESRSWWRKPPASRT